LIYDSVAGWLPNHDRALNPKSVGGIMARVEITFAVYRPPRDDLPHLVVVLAEGKVFLTEPVKSFEEGEELVDYLSHELLKASPPRS
jgi:exonuclease VII small subunit